MLKIRKSTNKWANDATQNLKEKKKQTQSMAKIIKTTAEMNKIETKGKK